MKKKFGTRLMSCLLALLVFASVMPIGTVKAGAASYSSDYRYWSQGASAITGSGGNSGVRRWGCWIVAQSKMIYEANINRESSFNPDSYYYWEKANGYVDSGYSQINGALAPVAYAKQRGKNLNYLGNWSAAENQIWFNINAGYYTIVKVYSGNGVHFILVDNATSRRNGKIYIYDSSKKYTTLGSCLLSKYKTITSYVYKAANSEPVTPTRPDKPTITSISSSDIAVGKTVTVSWQQSPRATSYNVAIRGAETRDIAVNANATSCAFTLNNIGVHSIYVEAKNDGGTSLNNNYRTCTTHAPVTVKFVDYDDTLLSEQKVEYGGSAKAPVSPERKGYSFQGWSDSMYNLTNNKTIKAEYKINTYTVNFLDKEGNLLKSEKVEYGKDATPPTDTNAPTGYSFLGWDSDSYKNVYTDSTNKTIRVNGIYSWFNDDLPVVCEITSAKRQSDGYYAYFDLTNYDKNTTRGRAVVSLKTASGKLVDATESAAFSIPKNGTKTGMEVFIPCESAATNIEIVVVDSYSSGVPISEKVTEKIDQGLNWSEWSTKKPEETSADVVTESRTEYRYRDKEYSTGNTQTKSGWIYTGNRSEQVGEWSGWGWNWIGSYDNESQRREVQTQSAVSSYNYKTVWNYYRWAKQYSGGYSSSSYSTTYTNYYEYSFDSELGTYASGKYKWWYNGSNYCVLYPRSPYTSQVQTSANYGTQYRYRDINYVYSFYRWNDWSDWSANEVAAGSNREVETRTTYRFKSTSAGVENDEGKVYTISDKLDPSFAGKQITLYVYGYTGASDYTNEYIGQSVVGEDGSYSFTFKLREEPTVKTGDFTVAIGIEGTTNRIEIDTIKAPKPTYTVKFYDWDGTVINTQTVAEGENAVLPESPSKNGYDFLGWDKSVANITEDTEFFADFKKQKFTVVFVDWQNQLVEVKNFEYGDVLTTPDYKNVEGYTFEGWDEILNGNTIVTKDMVVTATYEAKKYTVNFYDFDGNIVSSQEVNHGGTPVFPDEVDDSSDGKKFAGWFNTNDCSDVQHDIAVYPAYYFEETTPTPTASVESGEYSDTVKLELSTTDENAVIYYSVNDGDSEEQIYTEPLIINKTCSVSYYAVSIGKNDSEKETKYYCINNAGEPSKWMLYADLPSDVKENTADYLLESKTGYKFKNIQNTSSVSEAEKLKKAGWTFEKNTKTAATAWQDQVIAVDNSKIDFTVETQQVDDTTVTRYKYSHYKYTDSDGNVKYSPTEVSGVTCEYETVTVDSRISISGFLDDGTSYYNYNDQQWFKQTKVNGVKTQYRSYYQISSYYKWSDWDIVAPASNETREYLTETVYRYSNKSYHIVKIFTGFEGSAPYMMLVEDGTKIDSEELNSDGYNIAGLYTDEQYSNAFDSDTEIKQSMSIYVDYTPKKYTVVFQMQDGTELDTQTVEFMSSATPPSTDSVPGYVFGGWEDSFDCITEDTVITGRYYKETEYPRITLDKSQIDMYQGNSMSLYITINPEKFANEDVQWSSSDPNIATVDENGTVTAVSPGTVTVTVKVLKNNETASCNVRVNEDVSNYILFKSNSSLNCDSLGYVRRVSFNSSVKNVADEFKNDNLKFYNINGNEIENDDIVGTGTIIKLIDGDNILDTKTVVVTGDMTGDGILNNRDVAMVNRYLVGKVTPEECCKVALDLNGDGYVNNKDAAMAARYLVGKEAII